MRFRSLFLNQFQAKRINAHWCALARLHYSICTYTCNLAAVHGERFSVVVLYREGKMQFCEGFVKEWLITQHTNTSLFYREGFSEGWRRQAVPKALRLFKKSSWNYTVLLFCKFRAFDGRLLLMDVNILTGNEIHSVLQWPCKSLQEESLSMGLFLFPLVHIQQQLDQNTYWIMQLDLHFPFQWHLPW